MPAPRISSLSREELTSAVAAKRAGSVVDPRSGQVRWAFKPAGTNPGSGDWVAGTWDTVDGAFLAVVIVGPGGAEQLTPGEPHAWVRVTLGGEDVIRDVGPVVVY